MSRRTTSQCPRKWTRRQFVARSAAFVAAPYIVPARALGRQRRSADAAPRRPANERIALGFIGMGNMGGGHLANFLGNADAQVVAVCDVDRVKRDEARQRVERHYAAETGAGAYRGCAVYHEFEELLDRDDVDAVLIATPDHWHAIIAVAACRAGKDVYCEKPLALTVREARATADAARRYGRVFQTGSQQRSDRHFRRACELVRNGRIGRLRHVNVGIGGPSADAYLAPEPVREGLDWDRWLGPAPWQPYSAERCSGNYSGGWRLIRDYSGGMTTDWGAHHIDIAQWALGMDDGGPVEVVPPAPQYIRPRTPTRGGDPELPAEPEPGRALVLRYAGGAVVFRGNADGLRFTGEDGVIEVNRGWLRSDPPEIARAPIAPNEIHLPESDNHAADWLRCIRTRARPIADVEVGCRTVTACHLANIAYWTGRTIRWDPVGERIVDDEAAARWLDRPRRAPWRIVG